MKKILYLILLIIIFLLGSVEVIASSGYLRNASIKTCNGIIYGQHSSDNHWHIAEKYEDRYYATGSPIYGDPCSSNSNSSNNNTSDSNSSISEAGTNSNASSNSNSNEVTDSNNNSSITKSDLNNSSSVSNFDEKEEIKSNDNTLKNIIIDGKMVDVEDNINYITTNEKIAIKVVTNDRKAKYEVKDNSLLKIGENKIIIEVTAEDGSIKTYNINVKRDKILSSNTGLKVIINGMKISFSNNKSTIYISSTETSLKIDYTLDDENAKIEIGKIDELKFGDNELKIKVIAEDGTEKNYKIIIHKYTKSEEIISMILGLVIIGGMGYGLYYFIKKLITKFNNIIFKRKK